MDRIKVGVNGYGVIGKRVADAVHAQPDMQLTGVADIVTDWRIQSAVPRLPVFAATPDAHSGMVDTGIRPEGTLDDLLAQLDERVIEAERKLAEAREQQRTLERQAQEAIFAQRSLEARRGELVRTIDTAANQAASIDTEQQRAQEELAPGVRVRGAREPWRPEWPLRHVDILTPP